MLKKITWNNLNQSEWNKKDGLASIWIKMLVAKNNNLNNVPMITVFGENIFTQLTRSLPRVLKMANIDTIMILNQALLEFTPSKN